MKTRMKYSNKEILACVIQDFYVICMSLRSIYVIKNIQISKLHVLHSVYGEKQNETTKLNLFKNLTASNKNPV